MGLQRWLDKEFTVALKGKVFKNPLNEPFLVVDVILGELEDVVILMNDEGNFSYLNSVLMLGLKEIE